MVTLNRIYTRTGDAGATRLASGAQVSKSDLRVEAYGAVDETNACLGLARVHTGDAGAFDALLARLQNELFDLGADLATPAAPDEVPGARLRILDSQVTRLEGEIDVAGPELARQPNPRPCRLVCGACCCTPLTTPWRCGGGGGGDEKPRTCVCGSRFACSCREQPHLHLRDARPAHSTSPRRPRSPAHAHPVPQRHGVVRSKTRLADQQ